MEQFFVCIHLFISELQSTITNKSISPTNLDILSTFKSNENDEKSPGTEVF